MYNKTIITGILGFCDIQNNQGLGKSYQPQLSADNPYPNLDYSGYHKKPHPIIVIWNCITINCIILSRGSNVEDLLKLLIRNAFVFRTKSKLYLNEGLQ